MNDREGGLLGMTLLAVKDNCVMPCHVLLGLGDN